MSSGDLGYSFRITGQGTVLISREGKVVTELKGRQAEEFSSKVENLDADGKQQLMARVTGHYKHGNERMGKAHPRNR